MSRMQSVSKITSEDLVALSRRQTRKSSAFAESRGSARRCGSTSERGWVHVLKDKTKRSNSITACEFAMIGEEHIHDADADDECRELLDSVRRSEVSDWRARHRRSPAHRHLVADPAFLVSTGSSLLDGDGSSVTNATPARISTWQRKYAVSEITMAAVKASAGEGRDSASCHDDAPPAIHVTEALWTPLRSDAASEQAGARASHVRAFRRSILPGSHGSGDGCSSRSSTFPSFLSESSNSLGFTPRGSAKNFAAMKALIVAASSAKGHHQRSSCAVTTPRTGCLDGQAVHTGSAVGGLGSAGKALKLWEGFGSRAAGGTGGHTPRRMCRGGTLAGLCGPR